MNANEKFQAFIRQQKEVNLLYIEHLIKSGLISIQEIEEYVESHKVEIRVEKSLD